MTQGGVVDPEQKRRGPWGTPTERRRGETVAIAKQTKCCHLAQEVLHICYDMKGGK